LLAAALSAAGTTLHAQTVPASGQENATASRQSDLEGTVVDSRTGRPLALVTVEIPALRRSTVTDEAGKFRIERVPPGEHGMRVRLVGYQAHSRPVRTGQDAPIEVRLAEDPVLLAGLTVTVNRFDNRMKAVPYAVRVMDKRDVLGSAANDAAEFVISRAGLFRTGCRSIRQTNCFSVRGSSMQPQVYLDDAHMPAGIDMLSIIPREEINRVEVIRGGTTIRVYTDRFMEWAARNNYRPVPLGFY
jgi:hypothetical protein